MFSSLDSLTHGLTHGLSDATGLPIPDLPLENLTHGISNATGLPIPDIPLPLPGVSTTPAAGHDAKEGHDNSAPGAPDITLLPGVSIPLDPTKLLGDVTGTVGDALKTGSLSGIFNLIGNIQWGLIWTTIKTMFADLIPQVTAMVQEFLKPYKEYFQKHKALIIYVGIVIGILLIPIVLYLVLAVVTIILGLVLFLLIEGIILVVGAIVLVVVLIAIIIVAILVGLIIFGVLFTIEKIQDWAGSGSPETSDPQPATTTASEEDTKTTTNHTDEPAPTHSDSQSKPQPTEKDKLLG